MAHHPDTFNHHMYSTYLNEHLLGSEGGINAFKAGARTWKGTRVEREFHSLARQVADDHEDLESIMRALGYRPHPLKNALTHGIRLTGRLNPINVFRRRDAGMTQVELDVLIGMVRSKKAMWDTLLLVAARDERLEVSLLEDLVRRSDHQIHQLGEIIERTWEKRFLHDQ